MPIYAYKCSACGHAKDVLQKMSDPLLDTCPACGQKTFSKQLTAAGFQLKGSGWYVTDFRDGGKKPEGAAATGSNAAESTPAATPVATTESSTVAAPTPSSAPAASAPAPSTAPASPAP